jgi:hypothetical protein
MEERFNVVVFDAEGFWGYVQKDLDAEEAVLLARVWVGDAGNDAFIHRVMIESVSDETTAFLWQRGKGIVFPKGDPILGIHQDIEDDEHKGEPAHLWPAGRGDD